MVWFWLMYWQLLTAPSSSGQCPAGNGSTEPKETSVVEGQKSSPTRATGLAVH